MRLLSLWCLLNSLRLIQGGMCIEYFRRQSKNLKVSLSVQRPGFFDNPGFYEYLTVGLDSITAYQRCHNYGIFFVDQAKKKAIFIKSSQSIYFNVIIPDIF